MSGPIGAITAAAASTNPLFLLHPSDNPGALISFVVLKEQNYPEWATEMRNSLQAKQKLGFIDGTLTKPTLEPDLSFWLAANSMIIGWIRTFIDSKIRSTVSYESVAATLWESLRVRFSIGNGVRKKVLKDEIASCGQNSQPVLEHYERLTKLCGKNFRTTTQLRSAHAQLQQTYWRNEKMIEFTSSSSVSTFRGSVIYGLRSPVKIHCLLWIRFTHVWSERRKIKTYLRHRKIPKQRGSVFLWK